MKKILLSFLALLCALAITAQKPRVIISSDIGKQQWKGYYKGNGLYVLRHST